MEKVAALLVSLLLGVMGGLVAAGYAGDSGTAAQDPLHLGIPMVNLPCNGQTIVQIGRGDTRASLRTSIVNASDGEQPRYLEVTRSCDTAYAAPEAEAPRYAVYLGPYPDATAACAVRMRPQHVGDAVTRLHAGNEIYVKCPCEMSTASMPTLAPGMQATTADTNWVKQLQGMLADLHRLRPEVDETGVYDTRTEAAIRRIQRFSGLTVNGVVDSETWEHVANRACRSYDY